MWCQTNNLENNFEILWEDFNEHYALFGVKSVNWNALYHQYRPMVSASTTENDFDTPTSWFTNPEGSFQFKKPVILLTDRFTASGAEIFSLNMRAFEYVTVMGDSTAGDFSDISNTRFLPNGWVYTYSPQLYLTPTGQSLEGIGIVPEIYIKNTKDDIEAGNDLVLEEAIQYLFDEYGIE